MSLSTGATHLKQRAIHWGVEEESINRAVSVLKSEIESLKSLMGDSSTDKKATGQTRGQRWTDFNFLT